MLLSSLILILLPVISAAAKPKAVPCLPSGTEDPINAALQKGGKSATVSLCPGSVHRLSSPIVFTAQRQILTTEGNPKGRERAMIIVEGANQSVAIQGDCKDCSWITVQSLVVDGNRPQLLRIPKGDSLLELGNAEGQTVRDCRLYEPRGWSALHFREGDRKNCRKAHIVDNDIGPCGEEWDDEYDGTLETPTPPFGNPRADGISLACKDSLVERNVVTDATDGAIVLFGSAGTEVRQNHVHSRTRVILGGINLVDYEPWAGDYSLVSVHHNHLHADSRYLKVGIVIGPSSWSDDTDTIVHSASVTDNTFDGQHFGFAIVVSSAHEFTVLRNEVAVDTKFSGVKGPRCPKAPENGAPTAFLINRGSARGFYQDGFVNGEVQHIICIDPPDENGQPYKAWRFRDSQAAIEARAEAALNDPDAQLTMGSSVFDARLAEAVVSYQMKLLDAMDSINDKIEKHGRPDEVEVEDASSHHKDGRKSTGIKEIDGMNGKVDILEQGEKRLQAELAAIQTELEQMSTKLKRNADDNKPVLSDVFKAVGGLKDSPLSRLVDRAGVDILEDEMFAKPVGLAKEEGLVPLWYFLGGVGLMGGGVTIVRRWRTSRSITRKGSKLY